MEEVLANPRNVSGGFAKAGFFPYRGVAAVDQNKLAAAEVFKKTSLQPGEEVEVALQGQGSGELSEQEDEGLRNSAVASCSVCGMQLLLSSTQDNRYFELLPLLLLLLLLQVVGDLPWTPWLRLYPTLAAF